MEAPLLRQFESSVQLVGLVFHSLLCTTETNNVQVNVPHCAHSNSALSLSSVGTNDEDDGPTKFSSD